MIRNIAVGLVTSIMLSGCGGSYVDSDIDAIKSCERAGLGWRYAGGQNIGGEYRRVECTAVDKEHT